MKAAPTARWVSLLVVFVVSGCFEHRVPAVLTCGPDLPACPQDMACTASGRCMLRSTGSCLTSEGPGRIGTLSLLEDFEALAGTGVWRAPATYGEWRVVFQDLMIQVHDDSARGGKVLNMDGGADHSAFIVTNRSFSEVDISLWLRIRVANTTPEGYAALEWDLQSDGARYMLTVLPGRWSLFGRRGDAMDTAHVGGAYRFVANQWYHVRMVHQGSEMTSYVCSDQGAWTLLSTTAFSDSAYSSGAVGLSATNASIDFDDVRIFARP